MNESLMLVVYTSPIIVMITAMLAFLTGRLYERTQWKNKILDGVYVLPERIPRHRPRI